MGQDQDDIILVPITTLQKKITGQDWLRWIMVSALRGSQLHRAEADRITTARPAPHPSGQDDDFFVRNLADMADLADQQRQAIHHPAGLDCQHFADGRRHRHHEHHAGVGHRAHARDRHPHGHRRTEGDVQQQFLVEAIVLSLLGGAIGILSGMAASYLITHTLGWPVLVSPAAILAAVVFSMAVGIFFGFYPARKAARLDPIDALRYE